MLTAGEEAQRQAGEEVEGADDDASLGIEAGPMSGQVTLTHNGGKKRKATLAAYEVGSPPEDVSMIGWWQVRLGREIKSILVS